MRKYFVLLLTALSIFVASAAEASAVPVNAAAFAAARDAASPVQEARWFCYNRYPGRFIHSGRCGHRRWHRAYRPRVFCYNRPFWPVFTLGKLLALKCSLAPCRGEATGGAAAASHALGFVGKLASSQAASPFGG